ncbi:MAG: porin family protein [Pseudomonadales bacterium]|nr:porin family protein [Pseudomonadales bacterium]
MYKILTVSLLLLFLPRVNALDVEQNKIGWYLGSEFNSSQISIQARGINPGGKVDDNLNGLSLYSGVNILSWLGVEFGLSKGSGFKGSSEASIETAFVSSKFSYSFDERYSLYVKPGVVYAQLLDYELDDSVDPSWSDFSFIIMAGIEINILSDIYTRLEYKHTEISLEDDNFLLWRTEDSETIDMTYKNVGISLFYIF